MESLGPYYLPYYHNWFIPDWGQGVSCNNCGTTKLVTVARFYSLGKSAIGVEFL